MRAHCTCVAAALLLLAGCGPAPDPRTDDQPTKGSVTLVADQDLANIVEAELLVFHGLYPKASIHMLYRTEAEALALLGSDSVRATITFALPGAEQEAALRERRIVSRPVPIFHDAIALVVHPQYPGDRMSVPQLRALLTPGDSSVAPALRPLFVGSGSGVARSLIDSLGLATISGQAEDDLDTLLARVAADPRVLGLVPFNAIADLDDPHVRKRRSAVRLLPLAAQENGPAILPSQSTIADRQYPLRRTAYMVLTEGKSGLGTGFVSFVSNHKGQRIILKCGVPPVQVPAREVEIVHQ